MQELIQITRESALKLRRDDFIEVHRVTPEEAQVARAIVEQNLLIISYLFENMEVTEDWLDQISDDPQTLEKYSKMWNAMEANDAQTYRLLFDDIKLEPDLYCGWLDFYNECLTNCLQLNLMPATRDGYNYERYLDGDSMSY